MISTIALVWLPGYMYCTVRYGTRAQYCTCFQSSYDLMVIGGALRCCLRGGRWGKFQIGGLLLALDRVEDGLQADDEA